MKAFAPIIKTSIGGGISIVSVYAMYLIATEATIGKDLTSILSSKRPVNLNRLNRSLQEMGQTGLTTLLSDATKKKKVEEMLKDSTNKNVVVSMAKACSSEQNKANESCKDIGKTLEFLSETLKNNSNNTSSGTKTSEALSKASPEQLIKYLDTTQMLEKSKQSLNSKTLGLSDGLFDAYASVYKWFAFKNMKQKQSTTK